MEAAESISQGATTIDAAGPDPLSDLGLEILVTEKLVTRAQADIAALVVPIGDDDSEEPVIVNRGVLRVIARIIGEGVDRKNRMSHGRMAIARIIGFGPNSRHAHLALMEISADFCRPTAPDCTRCPASGFCVTSGHKEQSAAMLPLATTS